MLKGFLFLLLLFIAGCSTQQQVVMNASMQPNQNLQARENTLAQTNWKRRQQVLLKRQKWSMDGRTSISYRDENWPFNIRWKQTSAQTYVMDILNPITHAKVAVVTRDLRGVSLQMADGRVYKDSSAERLIYRHLKMQVPIEGMQYWIRGIPAPLYRIDRVKLDNNGRAILLSQSGWVVNFKQYNSPRYDGLPTLIVIYRDKPERVQVKMRAKRWY